ncbi:MAG: IclR family transcriptional regulator [Alphaproteobacteria bacterium]|nr:MAG: IclR family transcriptional regulator [Alphaproteobacteria bacterium]
MCDVPDDRAPRCFCEEIDGRRLRGTSMIPEAVARAGKTLHARVASDHRSETMPTATRRCFAILNLVAHSPTAIDVADVVETLALPKATAYRLVEGLVSSGYLVREPVRKRLTVGSKLTGLAFGAMRASMREASRHAVLRRLARTMNETCNIGTMLNGEIVYLDRVEAEHWPLRLHFEAGSRVPVHATAIGKLHLALVPSRLRRTLLRSIDLPRFTSNTIMDRAALDAELKRIRKEQVSFDREEFLAGVICAAVPITRKNGELMAGVAVQAPSARLSLEQARKHLPALRQAAAELSSIFESIATSCDLRKNTEQ